MTAFMPPGMRRLGGRIQDLRLLLELGVGQVERQHRVELDDAHAFATPSRPAPPPAPVDPGWHRSRRCGRRAPTPARCKGAGWVSTGRGRVLLGGVRLRLSGIGGRGASVRFGRAAIGRAGHLTGVGGVGPAVGPHVGWPPPDDPPGRRRRHRWTSWNCRNRRPARCRREHRHPSTPAAVTAASEISHAADLADLVPTFDCSSEPLR
jgi:hypothetical protein